MVLSLLLIELIDEFFFGALEASWPLIRDDLALTYFQIGLLLSLPRIWGSLTGIGIGILGDVWRRRLLILGGGVVFCISLALVSISGSFLWLLVALALFDPASGAFVGLSQATLMDSAPARHEQNMARWTFFGALGMMLGAVVLSAMLAVGFGWRELTAAICVAAVLALASVWRLPLAGSSTNSGGSLSLEDIRAGVADAFAALRRGPVLRWLALLEFSNLMGDSLHNFLALYFVDVAGFDEAEAVLGVAVWTGVGLLGDLLLIPLLERMRGLTYLRYSAVVELVMFVALLTVPGLGPKLVIVGILGFANAGWYSILKAQLYTEMRGMSGTVLAVNDVSALVSGLAPLGLGLAARSLGLGRAIWLLAAGPVALLVGIPRARKSE